MHGGSKVMLAPERNSNVDIEMAHFSELEKGDCELEEAPGKRLQRRRKSVSQYCIPWAKESGAGVEIDFLDRLKDNALIALCEIDPDAVQRKGLRRSAKSLSGDLGAKEREKCMLEYLDQVSDEESQGESCEGEQNELWSSPLVVRQDGLADRDLEDGSNTDNSLDYLDTRQVGEWDFEGWKLERNPDDSLDQDASDENCKEAPIHKKELKYSRTSLTRGKRCGTFKKPPVHQPVVVVEEKPEVFAAASIGYTKVPNEILLRSNGVADRIIQKIAFKKCSKGGGRHEEEPTVLHALERRIKSYRLPIRSHWKHGVVHDMLLIEASKSPRWNHGLSDGGYFQAEVKDVAGRDAVSVESALVRAFSPSDVCQRVFLENGALVLDLSSSNMAEFDALSLVQVLQWKGEQIHNTVATHDRHPPQSSRHSMGAINIRQCEVLNTGLASKHITVLILRDNRLSDRDIAVLAVGIREAPFVEHLDLSRNPRIGWKGAATIAELLDTISILQHYRHHNLSSEITGIEPGTKIRHLDMSETSMGDWGIQILCEKLIFNNSVKHLVVNHCGITKKGATAIGWLMHENSVLESLKLGWNRLGGEGAARISSGLQGNNALRLVDLSNNALGDTGGSHIGYSLTENQGLRTLDLSGNGIGGKACLVIAEAVSCNRTLEVLNLGNNPLGGEGGHHLLQALADNSTLTRIGLQGTTFMESDMFSDVKIFNRRNPSGAYTLNLEDPAQRQIAVELVRIRERQGASTWQNVKFNGNPFELTSTFEWTKRLPENGILDVVVVAAESPPTGVEAMNDADFHNILQELSDVGANDIWRLALLQIITGTYFFSSAQAGSLLGSFEWRPERIEAAVMLFGRVIDPQNMSSMMEGFSEAELRRVYSMLGILVFFSPDNPTGRYTLDLSRQIHRVILARLLQLSITEGIWRSNSTCKNFRNVFLNGQEIDIDNPATFEFPLTGKIQLDFISLQSEQERWHPLATARRVKHAVSDFTFFQLMEVLRALRALQQKKLEEKTVEEKKPTSQKGKSRGGKTGKGAAHEVKEEKQVEQAKPEGAPKPFDRRRRAAILPTRKVPDAFSKIRDHMGELEELCEMGGASLGSAWKKVLARMESLGAVTPEFAAAWDSEMPALSPVEIIKSFAAKNRVTCDQTIELLGVLQNAGKSDKPQQQSQERVELVQTLFCRIVDPIHFASVLRRLTPEEQVAVHRRLGVLNIIPFNRGDCFQLKGLHFRLRLARDDESIAYQRICDFASSIKEGACVHDLTINGETAMIAEDTNMFQTTSVIARERTSGASETNEETIQFKVEFPQRWLRQTAACHIQSTYRGHNCRGKLSKKALQATTTARKFVENVRARISSTKESD
ncbi:hypothetical protein BSKO_10370 [Bryopsis sp. KO-2023]|nr:hypothetical protein BSKO_10370 [Bryopsis sp. KO-2023]